MQPAVPTPRSRWRFAALRVGFTLLCLVPGAHPQAQVLISEFLASNASGLTDEDGDHADWIELYNAGDNAVSLLNWALTDDDQDLDLWRFPAVSLGPKSFLVVFASGKNRAVAGAPLHTSFSLDAGGEFLALVAADGQTIVSQFSPEFPAQERNISYGISQSASTNLLLAAGATARYLVPTSAILGTTWTQTAFNDNAWPAGPTGVGYESAVPGFAVRNVKAAVTVDSLAAAETVLATPGQQSSVTTANTALVNFFGTDSEGHYGDNLNFPGHVTGADIEDFVVEVTATLTFPSAGAWTFGVNSDDGFGLSIGTFSLSYPDPRGPEDSLGEFNVPAAGEYPLRLVYYERGGGAGLELFAAPGSQVAWNSVDFRLVGDTANGGLAVRSVPLSGSGLTYRPLIATDVQTALEGQNASLFVRIPFSLASTTLESLFLQVQYDDGFVAWLNGTEVARRNAPAALAWNSAATAAHPNDQALAPELLNLTDRRGLLQVGANVLALQALNTSAADADLLLRPSLASFGVANQSYQYFATATPGSLNSTGFLAFVADTRFSVDRGFFTQPFSLELATDTPGATIYFTTNGTVPSPTNGFTYTTPITIPGTTVVRAAAHRSGFQPSDVDTQTYLFLDDVIRQSPTGSAPPGWPASWGGNIVNYGMDPNVVNDARWSATIRDDLQTIPSFSVVMNLTDLFNPTTGIYANPGQDGRLWERPCSVELIHPDGRTGFQVNAGIRIRGGYSRSTNNPKHAFRFFFREEYGDAKLRYPLFGDGGTDTFDAIDLRTFQNYSWSFEGDPQGIFLRDQINRDLQLAMGHQGERGHYYHLYINGQYWGLFNTCERPEASYGATYFGGASEDYDVIKVEAGSYSLNATDGTMAAWTQLYNLVNAGVTTDAAYEFLQGNNPDGTRNPSYANLLEVDNLIDYMLVILYGGNLDAPISNFLGNTRPNNWYGLRNRLGTDGFRFFVHDAEHTLLNVNQDRTGPWSAGDSSVVYSSPQWIWQRLQANPEFRLRVADHVHRHFFNGGVLTPGAVSNRFMLRKNEIDRAVVGESARWGDSKREPALTRDNWLTTINSVLNNYIPRRSDIVLNQLRADNLYPTVVAPTFSQHGGPVNPNYPLAMSAPSGAIYYTLDGADPRLRGGAVSPAARVYAAAVPLPQSTRVRARTLSGSSWSALTEADFTLIQTWQDLLLTEIMYHPPGTVAVDGDDYEFLELKNVGAQTLDLGGVTFTNGVQFTFPLGTRVDPGALVVLVANPAAFTNKYPGVAYLGTYTGRLNNAGELVALNHAAGAPITAVQYDDADPWPPAADGIGFSIVPVNPNLNPNPSLASNWRASTAIGGSPGQDDPALAIAPVRINEVLTHTDPPQLDSIELHNPNTASVDISYWFLTDNRATPRKFRIPAGTTLPAGGYCVFNELDFNPTPGVDPSFNLSSYGEEVYLYAADANSNLTGYSHGFAFGAAANGVSFGRLTTSTGEAHYPAQSALSFGTANTGPRIGPVVINEIHYHPLPGDAEFVELKNLTATSVPLFDPAAPTNTWHLDGLDFALPAGATLPAHGLALIVENDPATFRARHAVDPAVPIFGPFSGVLQNNGESLRLQRPDHPDVGTNGVVTVPYYDADVVRYGNQSPWPVGADGLGASLERINAAAYGNDPINWRPSPGEPSPGIDNTGNRRPAVTAGTDQSLEATLVPAVLALQATVTDDGQPNPPGLTTVAWSQISGPGPVAFASPNATQTTAAFPGIGTYALRCTASDGQLSGADDLIVTLTRSTQPVTLVPAGSVWRYWDQGTLPAANWTTAAYSDAAWPNGAAQLGYSNGEENDETTLIGYGPNAGAKYITTWFRHAFTVTGAAGAQALSLEVVRDDGVVVYLNGTEVFRSNMPEGTIGPTTPATGAVGGADENTFYPQNVDPSLLREGSNLLAVELHQSSGTSSDVSFDLRLTAATYPANTRPTANPGAGQSVPLTQDALLSGSVSDDGLPIPPGLLTTTWSQVSGPGTTTFLPATQPQTRARFSAPGAYVLRLTATDGALAASNTVSVTVTGDSFETWRTAYFNAAELANPAISGPDADPDLDGHSNLQEYQAGTHPRNPASVLHLNATWDSDLDTLQLRFDAVAGRSYSIQYRASPADTGWQLLQHIPATGTDRPITLPDPAAPAPAIRYYRLVTPQTP